MLYPVKVFDGEGNLKKIVTQEIVEERFWKNIKTNNHIFAVQKSKPNLKILIKTIICKVCEEEFTTTHAKTLYCGAECAHKMVEKKRKEKIILKRKARENAKLNEINNDP